MTYYDHPACQCKHAYQMHRNLGGECHTFVELTAGLAARYAPCACERYVEGDRVPRLHPDWLKKLTPQQPPATRTQRTQPTV